MLALREHQSKGSGSASWPGRRILLAALTQCVTVMVRAGAPCMVAALSLAGAQVHAGDAGPVSAAVADPCAVVDAAVSGMSGDAAHAKHRELDWSDHCRYAADNAARTNDAKVVFIGDSLTEGWQKEDPAFFANGFVGRGISGQSTPQMLVRFRADVIDLHPDTVHILAGTNDFAGNTGPTSDKAVRDNIRSMAELARAHGIRVLLGSLLPAKQFWWAKQYHPAEKMIEHNAWLRQYAKENGFTFVDYYSALDDGSGGLPKAYAEDGVHPNAAGYAVMEPLFLSALAEK